jgi:hypothetical protein
MDDIPVVHSVAEGFLYKNGDPQHKGYLIQRPMPCISFGGALEY